jgi:predicted signal transduction protein with EAL and GGDEF domain
VPGSAVTVRDPPRGGAQSREAHRIADRIETELRSPFSMGDREWFISASLGISLGRPGRATPDEMLREAEIAMVKAKSDPAKRHAVFEPSMSHQTIERIDLENDLRRGIDAASYGSTTSP